MTMILLTQPPDDSQEIHRLIERAARQDVTLDPTSARALAGLGTIAATRKLDGVCHLIRAGRTRGLELSFQEASQRIEARGGNVAEAIRRLAAAHRAEIRKTTSETIRYAADRGLMFAPSSIEQHLKQRGRRGTQAYIDQLGAIMDTAAIVGADCSQTLATRRLSLAEGDARQVIADFVASHRRRLDRQTIACRVPVPPHAPRERANAFAGCGCQRCCDRLAAHMQGYIGKLVATPLFQGLDREEASAIANLELIQSLETWPGGNFTGWFAIRLKCRVLEIYRSRSAEERKLISLDAAYALADDESGRIVSLGERVPDRSIDVLIIVLLRERLAEAALQLRRTRAERSEEYTGGF
jgi:hypothetical protein